jgi:ribonuclease P protein component
MSSIARKITQFSRHEVNELFTRARRITKNTSFLLLAAPRTLDFGRVLIVISRKVGNAPERNKVRRRIKAIFYQEKLFLSHADSIMIVYKDAVNASFDQLKALLLGGYQVIQKQVM